MSGPSIGYDAEQAWCSLGVPQDQQKGQPFPAEVAVPMEAS